MSDLLFDTPWWMLTLIAVIAVALLVSGNARQHKPLIGAGLIVLLIGVALAALSYLVDTPREKVIKGTHALVAAVVKRDKKTIAAELHPNAALVGWNRQQIIDGAVTLADRFGLQSASIIGITVQPEPAMIVVTVRVLARFSGNQMPYDTYPTDWQLTWRQTGDGQWLLKDINPIGNEKISGNQLSRAYFSGAP
jgi:hypothetical protein